MEMIRINKERDTKIDEAHRWKKLAESLQKRYSSPRYPAWRRRRGILNRIRSYHRKAGIYWRPGLGKHLLRL